MKRLIEKSINTPEEYDRIFKERQKKGVDWFDMRRWKNLLKYWRGDIIADLGCHDSWILHLARTSHAGAFMGIGIDQSPKTVEFMNDSFRHSVGNGGYYVGDVYNLKIVGGVCDYVVMGELIEHLEDPEKAIKEAFRILKPGGILAISTPLEEIKELGAVDKDRHLWSFSKQDIINLLKPHSRKIKIRILGSRFFPYKYCWPQLIAFAWKK